MKIAKHIKTVIKACLTAFINTKENINKLKKPSYYKDSVIRLFSLKNQTPTFFKDRYLKEETQGLLKYSLDEETAFAKKLKNNHENVFFRFKPSFAI